METIDYILFVVCVSISERKYYGCFIMGIFYIILPLATLVFVIWVIQTPRIPSTWYEVFLGKKRIKEQEERHKKLDEFLQNQNNQHTGTTDIYVQMAQLDKLWRSRLITDEEFYAKRSELLKRL